MDRRTPGLAAAATLLLAASSALALPAPWTEAELMSGSDLVVDAECVQIICEGPPLVEPTKVTTTYRSTLFPSHSYKGGLPSSFQIIGWTIEYTPPPGPVGGWHQGPVAKGWAGKLYLKKLPDNTYAKVWWNGMEEDQIKSSPEQLPLCATTDGGPDAATDAGPPADAAIDALAPDGATPDAGPQDMFLAESDPMDSAHYDQPSTPADDGGCSCRVGASASQLPLLGLLLLLAIRRRRRR